MLRLSLVFLTITLATACSLKDRYNDGTESAAVRYAFFTKELPPRGSISFSDFPSPVTEFDAARDSFVYFIVAVRQPVAGQTPQKVVWISPTGKTYAEGLSQVGVCKCSWSWDFSSVFAGALLNQPGLWKVELYLGGDRVGSYSFRIRGDASARMKSLLPAEGYVSNRPSAIVSRGYGKEAQTYYENLGQLFEGENRRIDAARAYNIASFVALQRGDYQTAINLANEALPSGGSAMDTPETAYRAYQLLFGTFQQIGDLHKASFYNQQRLALVTNSDQMPYRQSHLADTYRDIGRTEAKLGRYDDAIKHLKPAIAIYTELIEASITIHWAQRGSMLSWYSLGEIYLAKGHPQDARQSFKQLGEVAKLSMVSQKFKMLNVLANVGLGLVNLQEGKFREAHRNFRYAQKRFRRWNRPHVEVLALEGIAKAQLGRGNPERAIRALRVAIGKIESLRTSLDDLQLRETLLATWLSPYDEIIITLIDLGEQKGIASEEHIEAFHYAERARARAFLDLLGNRVNLSAGRALSLAEEEQRLRETIVMLERTQHADDAESTDTDLATARRAYTNFLARIRAENPEQASLMTVEPLTLGQIQHLLDRDSTLLEYFVTEKKTILWVIEKDRFYALVIPISRDQLLARVNELRTAIARLSSPGQYEPLARELYDRLVGPALPHIRGKTLIVVPHDFLHYLPFHALQSPQRKFLVEDHIVQYLSSASLLRFTREKRGGAQRRSLLAVGNPDLGRPEMNLAYAETEVKDISRFYPAASVLVGPNASEKRSKRLSAQHEILHFATHAELKQKDPMSSALLLAKSRDNDGKLQVREVFGMHLKAKLVVLSACETALGRLSRGDEFIGLTRAFIYAGTPSVVASLWRVEDSSTAELMSAFHRNLQTMGKAEALRQAQLAIMKGDESQERMVNRGRDLAAVAGQRLAANARRAHPFFWAPFVLVGDGS